MSSDDTTRRIITLTAGESAVEVHPEEGGRIGQITVAGQPLLIDVPAVSERTGIGWGMYPMAPWAGRIREGAFTFDGVAHRLEINHHDGDAGDATDVRRGHSIHGTVHDRAWTVTQPSANSLALECPLAGALDWPYAGMARQRLDLAHDRLDLELVVDTDAGRFPAEVGWHPWFRKPDHLDFAPREMYQRDVFGLPSGALVSPSAGPWDDCFLNTAPVVLRYDRDVVGAVTVVSDCTHTVVYDQPVDATCVEPQSGPPDAFNLIHHVVDQDTPLQRHMSITW